MGLPVMLGALGLELHVVEDLAALKRIGSKLVPREVDVPLRAYRWGKAGIASRRFVKRIAREGGFARARALTPAQRSASARMAAKARWSSAFAPSGIAARPDRGRRRR
jgi:hypothetical protein